MFSEFAVQVKGQTIQDFISEAQDKSRNALAKSNQAAFRAFAEQLKSDQALFEQEAIMILGHINADLYPTNVN